MPQLERIRNFILDGRNEPVVFNDSTLVTRGVVCETYTFARSPAACDLGMIAIDAGCKTPRQKVLGGDLTLEGYYRGESSLCVWEDENTQDARIYEFSDGAPRQPGSNEVYVQRGQIMQWFAHTPTVAFEICWPPYTPDRFLNVPDL